MKWKRQNYARRRSHEIDSDEIFFRVNIFSLLSWSYNYYRCRYIRYLDVYWIFIGSPIVHSPHFAQIDLVSEEI